MKKILRRVHYINTPVIKEKRELHLVLVNLQNKVWNPVFVTGTITFVCSMLFRGFLNAELAVIPLALSTFILFAGVWILSANGMVVFDKIESNCYCSYKHLGYLQKVYTYPLTSIDKILLEKDTSGRYSILFLKDDGITIRIAESGDGESLSFVAAELSRFLKIPLDV
ncbi:MAG: hypothetical protein ABIO46_13915 [Chitinophagales bacterium]